MKKILIVDDDHDLVAMLSTFLEMKDLCVEPAYSVKDLPDDFEGIDLVLLDINMPGDDGFHICQMIRKNYNIPILFLSARGSEKDRIHGLMIGGDDYIVKPFSLEELYARIHTNLYREERLQEEVIKIDYGKRTLSYQGHEIILTRIEFDIVELLFRHPKQVFDKERIYENIWGYDSDGDALVVAEHIRNIRNKIKEVTNREYIKTIWGIGYSWNG
ncbi:MAG: response regulator transcription factor [Tissierellia bacterium]|nr:response regulator transcription factor [Tissierellia bacterium]